MSKTYGGKGKGSRKEKKIISEIRTIEVAWEVRMMGRKKRGDTEMVIVRI